MATRSKTRRTVQESLCPTWIYGPQVSEKNKAYGVGGDTWKILYDSCGIWTDMYGDFNREDISKIALEAEDKTEELIAKSIRHLRACKLIVKVLLIHSALINAFGISAKDPVKKERLSKVFKAVYEETKKILLNKEDIYIFVTPEQFDKLDDRNSLRPKNIVLKLGTTIAVNDTYKLQPVRQHRTPISFTHPITDDLRMCASAANTDCTKLFEKVENSLFKPLAEVIACHCSFFKNKLKGTTQGHITLKTPSLINTMSKGDYKYFSKLFQGKTQSQKPPVLIRKYKNTCEQKTYLSQLFEKTCPFLYRPYYIKPNTNSKEDIITAARENISIAKYMGLIYGIDNLSVFETSILAEENQREKSQVPVFFVLGDSEQQEKLYLDYYAGPPTQFFTDVMKELLDKGVFIPSDTYFNNQRYELNTKFDLEKLECYKRLPKELKTAEFNAEITKDFYIFVGNLIHFAVTNNIELPFKMSRLYIMKLFDIFDFKEGDTNLEKKLLLISVYLLEKAPTLYTQQIIKIFENPKYLCDPALIAIFDPDLEDTSKGIRMNGYYTIDVASNNKHIYSENKKELLNNVIEYLYKTAIKHYFDDINSETPKPNKNLQEFFYGMHNTKAGKMAYTSFKLFNFQEKLGVIRKADIFLSGFGMSYDLIKSRFIPLLKLYQFTPLSLFNDSKSFKKEYITDNSLDNDDYNPVVQAIIDKIAQREATGELVVGITNKIKTIFLLYRILLNRGHSISKKFITEYNRKFFKVDMATNQQNMSNEDYHNEFVKLLLKAWSGTQSLLNKDYVVAIYGDQQALPKTHTCFNTIDFYKEYKTAASLYTDLIILVTEGTNFGEVLIGGKRK